MTVFILITCLLDRVLILYGEISKRSLLGIRGRVKGIQDINGVIIISQTARALELVNSRGRIPQNDPLPTRVAGSVFFSPEREM